MKTTYSKLPGHSHSQLNVLERRNEKRDMEQMFLLIFLWQFKKLNSVGIASCLVVNGNDKSDALVLNWCHVDRGHFD